MHGIAEKIQARLEKGREDAFRLIRKMVVAVATGEKADTTSKQTDDLADALIVAGLTAADFDRLIGEYSTYLRLKEQVETHPARTREAEDGAKRADELKPQIEKLQLEERTLRANLLQLGACLSG